MKQSKNGNPVIVDVDGNPIDDKAGRLNAVEYRQFNRLKALGAGRAVLATDLRGIIQGIPAPGAEVTVVRSDRLVADVIYRSPLGFEKKFSLNPDFLRQ